VRQALVTRSSASECFGLFATVFWIRLHAVLTELPRHFSTWELVGSDVPPRRAALFQAEKAVHDACMAIHAALNETELMWVALARHTEAHITQEGFSYGLEDAGTKKKKRKVLRTSTRLSTLGKHHSVDEITARTQALLAEHGGDQTALTLALAAKVAPLIEALLHAMRAYLEELKRA